MLSCAVLAESVPFPWPYFIKPGTLLFHFSSITKSGYIFLPEPLANCLPIRYIALTLPDVQKKSYDCDQDEHQRISQTAAAVVPLRKSVLTSLEVFRRQFQALLDVLIHEIRPEAVDGDASLGQRIACLILFQTGLAHFHSGRFGDAEHLVGILDGAVQTGQATEHFRTGLVARISRGVALHADGLRTRGKLRVRRVRDPVIAVTNHASRKTSGLKRHFVRTFFVHLVLEDVTFRADVLNRIHSRGA